MHGYQSLAIFTLHGIGLHPSTVGEPVTTLVGTIAVLHLATDSIRRSCSSA